MQIQEIERLKKLIDPAYGWGPFDPSDTKKFIELIDNEICLIKGEKMKTIKISMSENSIDNLKDGATLSYGDGTIQIEIEVNFDDEDNISVTNKPES